MTGTQKYALLSSLYIAQGLPFGFFMQSLPVLLRREGMELETIGFSAVLALPWAFKFLWAPALDRWGSRRGWIIAANALAVAALLLVSLLPLQGLGRQAVGWIFAGFFFINLCSATQDIATDGLAVNILSFRERGVGNGIQVAGYRVGMILGGGLLLAWFSLLGWQCSLWILAGMMVVATLPVAALREADQHRVQAAMRPADFLAFFAAPRVRLWLLILLTYKCCDHFAGTMVRPLLIDLGMSVEQLALVLGTVGFGAGLAGALLGGWLVNALGRCRALLLFGLIQALAAACWLTISADYHPSALVYLFSAGEHLAGGLATAALFTAMMDHCRSDCAGSDYTIQACLVVLSSLLAAGVSGVSAAQLGYPAHFGLAGLLGLVPLPLIAAYRRGLAGGAGGVRPAGECPGVLR